MAIFYVKTPGNADGELSWPRLLVAAIFLAILFGAAIYTGHDDKLRDLYGVLVHAFELLLGGAIGLVVGEGAAKKA